MLFGQVYFGTAVLRFGFDGGGAWFMWVAASLLVVWLCLCGWVSVVDLVVICILCGFWFTGLIWFPIGWLICWCARLRLVGIVMLVDFLVVYLWVIIYIFVGFLGCLVAFS